MGGRGISAWHLDEMAIAVCLYPTLRGVQLPTSFKCFGCSSCLSAWLTGWKVRGQAHSIHYQPHWGHSPLALPQDPPLDCQAEIPTTTGFPLPFPSPQECQAEIGRLSRRINELREEVGMC